MTPRSEEFKAKLLALLREYEVEMSVEESYSGYSTVVGGISFYAFPKWDADGEKVVDEIDFQLGSVVGG